MMLGAEILHGPCPVNVSEQTGITQAHPPQYGGRLDVERLLREARQMHMIDGIKSRDAAGQRNQQDDGGHHVDAARAAHFRFRRWKISTAPDIAIAEYSSA